MSFGDGLFLIGSVAAAAEGVNLYAKSLRKGGGSSGSSGGRGMISTNRKQPMPGWERNPPPDIPPPTAVERTHYEPIYNKMPAKPGEDPIAWLDRHSTASHGQPHHSHVYGICLAEDDK
jgi:hypothetical protein